MGRFKIYDPKKLVSIENDSNYCKCLLCGRKLKYIMGNIKRHYEQLHSVYVDANLKKCKNVSNSKRAINDSETKKLVPGLKTLDDLSTHKSGNKKLLQIPTASSSPTSTNQNNNITITLVNNSGENSQSKIEQEDKIIKTSGITEQLPKVSSLQLNTQKCNSPAMQECIKNDNFVGKKDTSKNLPDNQLSTYHSNNKKARLLDENDKIQIPCHSFISSIQINSVESCHQLEFLKCLVETKAHVNIPLNTFQNEDSFQKALQSWTPNFQFNYSPQTIGEHIDRMTKKLHQEIKRLAANRLIYLKLDIASITGGNVMLVNIQFLKDFRFQVITLNALELSDDNLATYLKNKVISTLKGFRIEMSNVFSITKDSTNNVREYVKNSGNVCEFPNNTKYCQNLSHGFPGHAIHFAANDVITQLNENIRQSRDAARNLQSQMLQLNTKSSILFDNNTNWFSVYDMIETLMNLHDEIENNSLSLIKVDWVFAKKFVESFKAIVDTASMLQTTEIVIMGDFYREWLLCEMRLEELAVRNELALYLLKALRKYKLEFVENSSFLAALYIDPRFCYMGSVYLSDQQKEMAVIHLLEIFNKLKAMYENDTLPFCHTNNLKFNLNDRYDKLEKHIMNSVETDIDTTTHYDAVSLHGIDEMRVKECLEELQFGERLAFKTHILEYWNVVKYKNPILAKIAEVALAAPATQATLSRAINATSITLLQRKLDESKENIKNLLMLKLNQALVDNISLGN